MNLSISNLSKTYANGVRALQDVSLDIPAGMFGLLGPNGAGKSTLMRTIATLQQPDSGSIRLGDIDVLTQPDDVRKILGYLPQEFGLYPNLSAERVLDHFAEMKGVADGGERRDLVHALLKQTNLWDARKKAVGGFSGGMKQRLGIAIALAGKSATRHRRRANRRPRPERATPFSQSRSRRSAMTSSSFSRRTSSKTCASCAAAWRSSTSGKSFCRAIRSRCSTKYAATSGARRIQQIGARQPPGDDERHLGAPRRRRSDRFTSTATRRRATASPRSSRISRTSTSIASATPRSRRPDHVLDRLQVRAGLLVQATAHAAVLHAVLSDGVFLDRVGRVPRNRDGPDPSQRAVRARDGDRHSHGNRAGHHDGDRRHGRASRLADRHRGAAVHDAGQQVGLSARPLRRRVRHHARDLLRAAGRIAGRQRDAVGAGRQTRPDSTSRRFSSRSS